MAADGRIGSELSRRLGAARADFEKLRRVWQHANLPVKRKAAIFDACVVAKLLYGLSSTCLTQVERRRLDGFHARCLRKVFRIAPSYYSRISNQTVWKIACSKPLSERILKTQCLYFGEVAARTDDDPTRAAIFKPGSFELKDLGGPRRRGRPRMEWGTHVQKYALHIAADDAEELKRLLSLERCHWKSVVRKHFE